MYQNIPFTSSYGQRPNDKSKIHTKIHLPVPHQFANTFRFYFYKKAVIVDPVLTSYFTNKKQ